MTLLRCALKLAVFAPNWTILSIAALASNSAAAEYMLQSGDTLEISVTGVSDLRQRSPIGVDGQIALPLVGHVKVDGLSVSAARVKIAGDLSSKIYRQQTNDGREIRHLILPDEVVVALVEYRPIYVSGDVVKAGEYVFRPSMTVRHAIALAGGYDLMRFRLVNPFLQAPDYRAEYEALSIELATEQARIWRLQNELGEAGVEYKANANNNAIPMELTERIMQAAAEHLKARIADREKDKALLQEAVTKATLQIDVLVEKKRQDQEGSDADTADFQKVKELFQKGIAPTTRLSDARRAALLASGQLLQTIVEMSNIERQRGEYARQLEKIDNQARIDGWRELQEANLRLSQITARLKAAREKLMYTGMLRSALGRGMGGQPKITVHRKGGSGLERLTADEDMELSPGDVVDVALEPESPGDLAARRER